MPVTHAGIIVPCTSVKEPQVSGNVPWESVINPLAMFTPPHAEQANPPHADGAPPQVHGFPELVPTEYLSSAMICLATLGHHSE